MHHEVRTQLLAFLSSNALPAPFPVPTQTPIYRRGFHIGRAKQCVVVGTHDGLALALP